MSSLKSVAGNCLLFCLVFGMSATVDMKQMTKQIRNRNAILTALGMQFIVLPFIGFMVVLISKVDFAVGVTLLVITTSPGGSYSNLWVSLFNADLALSVATTAVSTIVSIVMLPLNLYVYSILAFDDNVADDINYLALFESIAVVIIAIGLGIYVSMNEDSHHFNKFANKLGNIAGLSLITFSALLSNGEDGKIWERSLTFYIAVAVPCTSGLIIANVLAFRYLHEKPELVTTSIESCYQNVGIATSVALTMFQEDDLTEAMGVPLFYGLVEAILLVGYCLISWKLNWTKAPSGDPLCKVLSMSYEVIISGTEEEKIDPSKDNEFTVEEATAKVGNASSTDDVDSICKYEHYIDEQEEVEGGDKISHHRRIAIRNPASSFLERNFFRHFRRDRDRGMKRGTFIDSELDSSIMT